MSYLISNPNGASADYLVSGPTALATTGPLDLYVYGETGSDSNDGLSASSPLKTIETAAEKLSKIIAYNAVIHCREDVTMAASATFYSHLGYSDGTGAPTFLIDGGSDTTIVAGPFTADIHSTTSIGLSTESWTTNAYAGYWILINDGDLAGTKVSIHSNTATTLVPTKNFSADPGTASFSIVRPTTRLLGSSKTLAIWATGAGVFKIQRLFVSGPLLDIRVLGPLGSSVSSVITDTNSVNAILMTGCGGAAVNAIHYESPTAAALGSLGSSHLCCAQINAGGAIRLLSNLTVSGFGLIARRLDCISADISQLLVRGSHVFHGSASEPTVRLNNCKTSAPTTATIQQTSGYATTRITGGSGQPGLKIDGDSYVFINGAANISGCGAHAMHVEKSRLRITAAVAGINNTGFGLFADTGAFVSTGATPTVDGTGGTITLDGTNAHGSWAGVAGGTPQINVDTGAIVKAE